MGSIMGSLVLGMESIKHFDDDDDDDSHRDATWSL